MRVELIDEIRDLIEKLDEVTTNYVFSKYPNMKDINEEDDNVKAYRALAPFIEDYLS